MTDEWKTLVHEGIVKYMPENARFKNGIPNIAAITRAGILADNSGEYSNPRIFDDKEIQRQVGLVHEAGTPIACVRWYRSCPGPRKTPKRVGFKEAYAFFKEQGKSIPTEKLAAIADANLHIIFGARGADLSILSEFGIMEAFKKEMEVRKQKSIDEKLAKARAARKDQPVKTIKKEPVEKVAEAKPTKKILKIKK